MEAYPRPKALATKSAATAGIGRPGGGRLCALKGRPTLRAGFGPCYLQGAMTGRPRLYPGSQRGALEGAPNKLPRRKQRGIKKASG